VPDEVEDLEMRVTTQNKREREMELLMSIDNPTESQKKELDRLQDEYVKYAEKVYMESKLRMLERMEKED